MSNLQLRAQVQASALQWANDLMVNHGVSAAMLEDAINALLVKLKEQIITEMLIEQEQMQQEQPPQEIGGQDDGDEED